MKNFLKNKRRAFTLTELIISLAIFLLVAVLVISFIAYLGNFSKKAKNNAQLQTSTQIRKNADLWFSYFDDSNYLLTVNQQPLTFLVLAQNKQNLSEQYYISFTADESETALTFTYPQNSPYDQSIKILCSGVYKVCFYSSSNSQFEKAENIFSFNVTLRVNSYIIGCDVIFEEE